jgi:hypothetical protein
MGRKKRDEPLEVPGRWVLLAQREVARRLAVEESSLDRELQMQARMKAMYPDIPVVLAEEFSQRLQDDDFTPEAWGTAVAWLEATKWFQSHTGR